MSVKLSFEAKYYLIKQKRYWGIDLHSYAKNVLKYY